MMRKVVIVLLLACALAGLTSATLQDIQKGGVIFIGEQGLNITAATNSTLNIEWFESGGNPILDAPSATLTVGDPGNFYVSPADFTGKTGNWYNPTDHTVVFNVVEPSIVVKPWSDTSVIDVTGKAVPAGEKIDFRVETNLYSIQQRSPSSVFDFKVKVTNPDGAVYTALESSSGTNLNLTNVPVSSSLFYLAGQDPTKAWNTDARDASNNRLYKSGTYSVSAECNANQIKDNYNVDGKTVATIKSMSIASDTLILTVNKDAVTRGQQFAVTITGLPSTTYKLFIKNPDTASTTPFVVNNQEGVTPAGNVYTVNILTSTSGTRTVGFGTDSSTKDKTYTVRVESQDASKSDEVTVKVQIGKVTVTDAGSGSYFIGEEVRLEGVNTETDTTYLFVTGPNLPSSGGKLPDPRSAVTNGSAGTFVQANVLEDNTWEYKWDTTGISVDSGTYTVYAVSEPNDKNALSNVQYGTTSIRLSKPTITATVNPSVIAKGDELHITGEAGSQPSAGIDLWIFGKNYFKHTSVSVDTDGTYDYKLSRGDTTDLATGQYYAVIQHPMYNGQFDVFLSADGTKVIGSFPNSDPTQNTKFIVAGAGSLQGSDAANALDKALDDPSVDDIYANVEFTVAEPQISLNAISDTTIGQNLTVSGTTNLAAGEDILIEILSSSFVPTQKTQPGQFSGYSKTVQVVEGSGLNEFSAIVDTSAFKPDEYVVTASGILTSASGTTKFDMVAATPVPTTQPTTVPTVAATTNPTAPPTVVATNTTKPTTVPTTTSIPLSVPTATPGFGVIVSLVGICVVGFFVMRRKE